MSEPKPEKLNPYAKQALRDGAKLACVALINIVLETTEAEIAKAEGKKVVVGWKKCPCCKGFGRMECFRVDE